jgi:predicted transposase/invertase (TIGR01784 family)
VIKINTKTGEKTDIYVLFEHKSYVDTTILWQLLRYQYLMLEEDYKAKRKFRIIVPIVFYHGKTKWKVEKSLIQTMKVPQLLKKYVLNFEYMLFDTRDFDLSQNEKFGKNVYLMSAVSLMKNRKSMTAEKMTRLFEYLVKGGMQNDLDLIVILLKYLLSTNKVEESEVANIIRKELGSKAEELMPSLAKKWFEQGKEEGIEKGIEKGTFLKAVETCRNLLKEGLSFETISRVTGLSLEKVLEIQKEIK